jgi:hypothetical protein
MSGDNRLIQNRKQAAVLLEAVLDERLEPRLAINRWPETADCPDSSLDVAYQALWYFESDEERQKSELFYMDAQLELLKQIAGFLEQGQALPAYMHQVYSPESRVRFFYGATFLDDTRLQLQRGLNWLAEFWRATWSLARTR